MYGLAGVGVLILVVAAVSVGGNEPEVTTTSVGGNGIGTSTTIDQATTTTVTSSASTSSSTTTTTLDSTIRVTPSDDVAAIVAAAPVDAEFDFAPGTYRGLTFQPKDGQVFFAQPEVFLTGARVLTDWVVDGSRWFVDGQSQQEWDHGECAADSPRCRHPEDLFVDGGMLKHVQSIGEVGQGTWFFDYGSDRIYIGTDPAGKQIETSVTRQAFSSAANNVEIRGFNIVRYANQAQHGVIDSRRDNTSTGPRGIGWVVEDNVIRQNHGVGVVVTSESIVRGNDISFNGQLGISAYGDDVVIDSNQIVGNNTAGFRYGWEGGGSKFKETTRLVVAGNTVSNNIGPGLWTDIDNVDSLIEANTVQDNAYIGIFHEISYSAVIRDNIVTGNGFDYTQDLWGAGITVAASSDVEVVGNVLSGNAGGIVGIQQNRSDAPASFGPVEINNLWVHNNEIEMAGGFVGLRQEVGDDSYYTSRNNRFENNTIVSEGRQFYWDNRPMTADEWSQLGLS